jgi:hypothetical protein
MYWNKEENPNIKKTNVQARTKNEIKEDKRLSNGTETEKLNSILFIKNRANTDVGYNIAKKNKLRIVDFFITCEKKIDKLKPLFQYI